MDQLTTEPTEFDNVTDGQAAFSGAPVLAGLSSSAATGRKFATGDNTESFSHQSESGIEFRVTRAGTPARRLRINSARCTLGSGAGCTVRLSDSDLRPLHAVVIREHGRILIRGYSVPIEVNGQATPEAQLTLGDVFRLGEYCFEMIDLPGGHELDEFSEGESNESGGAIAQPRNPDRWAGQTTGAPEASGITAFSKRMSFADSPSPSNRLQPKAVQPAPESIPKVGRRDAQLDEAGSSLAQVHAQAKRHAELLAALHAAQDQEKRIGEQLDAAVERCRQADGRADEGQESIRRLNDQIGRLNSQIQSLNDSARAEESRIAGETARLNETIQSLRQSESQAVRQRDALTVQRDEAIRQRDEAIRQRDEALTSRSAAIEGGANSRRDVEAARSQIADLNRKLQQTSTQLQEKSERLDSATTLAEQAQNRVEQLQRLCETQSQQISAMGEAKESGPLVDDVAIEKLENEIAYLRAELVEVSQKSQLAGGDQSRGEALQATLDAAMADQLVQKLTWEQRVAELQEKIAELSADLVQAAEELIRSRDEATETRKQIDELLATVGEFKDELGARPTAEQWDDLNRKLAHAEQELRNKDARIAEFGLESGESIRSSDEANEMREQRDELLATVGEFKAELGTRPTAEQWDDLNRKLADAEEELRNKEARIAEFDHEFERLTAVHAGPESDQPEATAFASQVVEDDALSSVREQLRNVISDLDTPQSNQESGVGFADKPAYPESASESGGDSDPSIDDYMANLLRRMGQDSGAAEATTRRPDEAELAIGLKDVQQPERSEETETLREVVVSRAIESEGAAESRKREFNERALRDALTPSPDAELVDPNADYDGAPENETADDGESGRSSYAKSNADGGDEDSVEAYMARLLQRMGGDPSAPQAEPETKSGSAKAQPEAQPQPAVRRARRGAPERHVSMDAMRELANANAASVLSVSSIKGAKDLQSKAFFDLVQAGVTVIAALAFFYCALVNPSLRLVWSTAGILALGLSAFFLYEMLRKLTVASVSEKSAEK